MAMDLGQFVTQCRDDFDLGAWEQTPSLADKVGGYPRTAGYWSSSWTNSSSFSSFRGPAHLRTNLRSLSRNTVVGKLRTS